MRATPGESLTNIESCLRRHPRLLSSTEQVLFQQVMDSTVRAKDCARVYASGNFCDARLFLFGPAHFILRGPNMRLFLLLTIVTVLLSDPGHLRSQDLQWNFDNDLGMVHPGDTACKQIFLVNIGNSSIDVTGIVIS